MIEMLQIVQKVTWQMAQIVTWGGLKKSHGEWADQVSWWNGLKRSHNGWVIKVI